MRDISIILSLILMLTIGLLTGMLIQMKFTPYKIYPINAPSDYIKKDQIFLYPNKVCFNVTNASISNYANTGSMRPTLDEGANGVEVKINSTYDLSVGDMITYLNKNNDLIMHRVDTIGTDDQGWFCIAKGDNNVIKDDKIRFEQIKWKTIAIIY